MTWPNIVFSRGLTRADALFDWLNKTSGEGFAADGNKLVKSTGAVTAITGDGTRLRSWELDGLPGPLEGTGLRRRPQNPLDEELEIAHHGFRSSDPS